RHTPCRDRIRAPDLVTAGGRAGDFAGNRPNREKVRVAAGAGRPHTSRKAGAGRTAPGEGDPMVMSRRAGIRATRWCGYVVAVAALVWTLVLPTSTAAASTTRPT